MPRVIDVSEPTTPPAGRAPHRIAVKDEPAVWSPCPTCWGQRRIFEDANGEGLVSRACPSCLGIGERLALLG
jgi:hypothetical protein